MSTSGPQPHATGQPPPSTQAAQAATTRPPPVYEFPKRKRWADLLLTELVDNIAFILSPSCKIWFVGTAVTEILGWRDTELIDLDFMELIDLNDRIRFNDAFQSSIQNSVEFNLPIKLNSSGSAGASQHHQGLAAKSVMFEMKCYPYVTMEKETETKCLIAMAVPSPGRNTAMLDTILDLQTRHDLLRRKVAELRERAPPETVCSGESTTTQAGSMYATSSLNSTTATRGNASGTHKSSVDPASNSFLSTVLMSASSLEGGMQGPGDSMDFANVGLYEGHNDEDEGSKKKKLKRSQNTEKHVCVTCGRTDSPEWRKGPLGPKTLCNACGLRWAKSKRKVDDPVEKLVPLSTIADPA